MRWESCTLNNVSEAAFKKKQLGIAALSHSVCLSVSLHVFPPICPLRRQQICPLLWGADVWLNFHPVVHPVGCVCTRSPFVPADESLSLSLTVSLRRNIHPFLCLF